MKIGQKFKCVGCGKMTIFTAPKKKYCNRDCFIKHWTKEAKLRFKLNKDDLKNRITSNVKIDNKTDCWIWQSKPGQDGYGKIKIGYKTWRAHRAAYLVFVADPGEKFVCHACDNPPCVNPSHLFLGTALDNMQDKKNKNRQKYAKGEDAGNSKLTNKQIKWVRDNYKPRDPVFGRNALANKLGISKGHLSDIVRGKYWNHVI